MNALNVNHFIKIRVKELIFIFKFNPVRYGFAIQKDAEKREHQKP